MPAGIVPTTSSQPSFASVSSGAISRSRERPAEALDDPHPVAPEEAEQDERGGEVGRDEEGDVVRVVLVDVPAEELRQDHRVAEARDREELRDALERPEDDRPGVRDQGEQDHASEAVRLGPLRNHANTKQAIPSRNAAMPCFAWWWLEPASWPGKKPGSEFAGSAQ